MRGLLAACLLAVLCGPAAAWEAAPSSTSTRSLAERCSPAPNGLPDGCVAQGAADIARAWYEAPTRRYAHAILGDAIEAGTLAVRTRAGATLRFVLPDNEVFEDRTPRLVDLDGDGRAEVITIRASVRLGGSVAVYGVREGALMELGATPFIGRANRWLNVAGVADFLGTGDRQIAFVETPHIGGTLKLARFSGGRLSVIASEAGYSNHEIRAREMRLSAVADIDGDGRMDLALPNASRSTLELVRFTGGRIATLDRVALPARVAGPIIADGRGDGLAFTMLLADGSVVDVRR